MDFAVPAVLIIDLEINPKTDTVFKIGAYRPDLDLGFERSFRNEEGFRKALAEMQPLAEGAEWLMGHNFLEHDLPYLKKAAPDRAWLSLPVIDTLKLSPLAFPQNPYHRLIKNYKIISSELNSPLADCRACWQLFQDQCAAFGKIKTERPDEFTLWAALSDMRLPYRSSDGISFAERTEHPDTNRLIRIIWMMMQDNEGKGRLKVCRTRFLELMKTDIHNRDIYPSLAYALSWLNVSGGNSVLAPWVRNRFPETARLIAELRDHDCGDSNCNYCTDMLNPEAQLQRYFKLSEFRHFKGFEGGQRAIVQSGMKGLHTLAVLPTGGGKSLCYQVPALNRYYRNGGLTVVISPLQSLMKDQLDGMLRKNITCAAMLNGLVEVVERAEILDKTALGDIGILLVAPEQFRNDSFISAISQRQINGWVFDEAHCLSKWGHDFRPDYLYAVKFIAEHGRKNGGAAPVSCFTATAKPDVLADITDNFREQAGIEFRQFIGDNARDNLSYEVFEASDGIKKQKIDELLHRELDHQRGGAVVFVGRRKSAEGYNEYLQKQGWACEYFHAGLETNAKADIQNRFIEGGLRVIVATNAFGMGVDKPDVRLVIHAEITGSLENYLQEAGRAGRDREEAKCILLYEKSDVDTQFGISKMSQIELRDLKTVWRKIGMLNAAAHGKDGCGEVVATGGEILKDSEEYMSFDRDDRQSDTKIKTAISWLERAELLDRKENRTRIFPSRSGKLTLEQASELIQKGRFARRLKEIYLTIAEIVFNAPDDKPLSTDDLIQATACSLEELRGHLHSLEEMGILTNDTRMTVILRTDNVKPSSGLLEKITRWEEKLWQILKTEIPDADQGIWQNLAVNAVCYEMHDSGLESTPAEIKQLILSFADDKSALESNKNGSFEIRDFGNGCLKIRFKNNDSWENIQETALLRRNICACILSFLAGKTEGVRRKDVVVETGIGEMVQQLADNMQLSVQIPANRRETLLKQALLFMHKLGIIKLNHGITILRHAMTIVPNRNALESKRQYLKSDYRPLETFYGEKRFQIHVMREYAERALKNITEALNLVADYFKTDEKSFKDKWFSGRLKELEEPVSPDTLHTVTDGLNSVQKAVVTDQSGRNRLVLAGPGSGKTRIIVHRVAYLLRVQHVPASSIIVLTFTRLAALEVKRRLHGLVGNLARAVTVLTYDGMAMRLLGVRFDSKGFDGKSREQEEQKTKEQFEKWCEEAAAMLSDGIGGGDGDEARERIMSGFRYILVDEYQDISERHYRLVSALAGRKRDDEDKLTILAVGDDDQNIFAYNGSSNEYIRRFQEEYGVDSPDFLTFNYRSTQNIIAAANRVISGMPDRLKNLHPIAVNPERRQDPDGGIWTQTDPERQGRVRVIRLHPEFNRRKRFNIQSQAVIEEIRRLRNLADIPWNSIAVLARNNDTLNPMQAWCEQNGIPYFLTNEQSLPLCKTREFVRLVHGIETAVDGMLSSADFCRLIEKEIRHSGKKWENWFAQLKADFLNEFPIGRPSENTAAQQHPAAFLKNWLYEYVGNEKISRSDGIFLGTAHSSKGLEFDHVFILDDGWEERSDENRRLYYVAMTRAKKTLTLICHSSRHPWINALPEDVERIGRTFAELPELNVEYRMLSNYGGALDIGFIARENENPSYGEIGERIEAAKMLKTGDSLDIIEDGGGNYLFCANNIPVAKTAKNFKEKIPKHARAAVAAVGVFYLEDVGKKYLEQYREDIPVWAVVIPVLMIPQKP